MLRASFAPVPDSRYEDIARFGKNYVAYNVTRYAEAYDDLANLGVVSRHAERRKILQPLDRNPDQFSRRAVQRQYSHDREMPGADRRRLRRRAKGGSSDLARLRARQFVHGSPALDPPFDVIERNSGTGSLEFVVATTILADIRTGKIDHRVGNATASANTTATSFPRSFAISRRRASVSASISSVRLTRFISRNLASIGRLSRPLK